MNYETMKQAGYIYIRKYGANGHILENIKAVEPYTFELWCNNKNHASYGIKYKNTHLEFASTYDVEKAV